MTIKKTVFSEVNFTGADFFKTKLSGIDFSDCEIAGIMVSDSYKELKGLKINAFQASEIAAMLGVKIV